MKTFTFWDVFLKKNLSYRFNSNSIMQIKIIKFQLIIMVLVFSFFWVTQSAIAKVILLVNSKNMPYQVETVVERLIIPWAMVLIAPDKIL